MSKFVSGVLGAKLSPSVLLAGGLMATAVINIAFGFGTSLAWFCFFWALNGTLQVSAQRHARAHVLSTAGAWCWLEGQGGCGVRNRLRHGCAVVHCWPIV